ncbi:unnamed protein product [Rotaria sordida]|uniref:Uncharacterized protein n=1 Tax=Rotaria sordida TaxID=392033 RepID=A0A819NDK1_9BILA|nr:unnamed protein product [Rotaria sordida]
MADILSAPYDNKIKDISQACELPLVSSLCISIMGQDQYGNILHERNLDFGGTIGWNKINHTWTLTEKLRP